MKRVARRIGILFIIFVLGIIGTSVLMNSEITDNRSDMDNPSLPEVMISVDGSLANRMCGYYQKMQGDFMRDSITPIDTSKKLTVVINPYDAKVESLSYEIRTTDGSKVVENKKINNLLEQEGYLQADIQMEGSLRMTQEYSLQITLETENQPVYYYTRIVQRSGLNTGAYVEFVQNFAKRCTSKSFSDELGGYLEVEANSNADNFNQVDIHSSTDLVTWGDLAPEIYQEGIPTIKDINETTGSLSLAYLISAKDTEGYQELYYVEEFYRLRYTEERVRLLDFERSATQIFSGTHIQLSNDGLILGVMERNVPYMSDKSGEVVAFVQQGDLWAYQIEANKVDRVFSFRRGFSESDFRDSRSDHDIKILNVTQEGNIDFVVYGYMNRGEHEGYTGVSVCHYNSDQNMVTELAFIPSTESYEFLKSGVEELCYLSGNDQLFVMLGSDLCQVDLEENTYQVIQEDVQEDGFAASETGAHAAWLDEMDLYDSTSIVEMDFDSQKQRRVEAGEGECIRVLGYMNEDLIYGTAAEENLKPNQNGQRTFAMDLIRIEGFDGEVKKEYQEEGMYLTNVEIGSTLMTMDIAKKSGSEYQTVRTDNVMNNKKVSDNTVEIQILTSSRKGVYIRLAFEQTINNLDPLMVYSKMEMGEENLVDVDTVRPRDEMYYVYARGGLEGSYLDPALAIQRADEYGGVVLNRSQQYVWERGNKKTQIQLNTQDIPEGFLKGTLDEEALQEAIGESGEVMNLTGCTLDSVLYEVSAQRPVVAKSGDHTSVVIVGYDAYNTYLYDPNTKETKPYGMNDSTQLFQGQGNVFYSYMENMEN